MTDPTSHTDHDASIEIRSGLPWPAGDLSNLAANAFVFRGFRMASMEGLLQGLKWSDTQVQTKIFSLTGAEARKAGRGSPWRDSQTVYWQSRPIDRHAATYQALLDEAYRSLFMGNHRARSALLGTGSQAFTHSLGKSDPSLTILTVDESCSRLERERRRWTQHP